MPFTHPLLPLLTALPGYPADTGRVMTECILQLRQRFRCGLFGNSDEKQNSTQEKENRNGHRNSATERVERQGARDR